MRLQGKFEIDHYQATVASNSVEFDTAVAWRWKLAKELFNQNRQFPDVVTAFDIKFSAKEHHHDSRVFLWLLEEDKTL